MLSLHEKAPTLSETEKQGFTVSKHNVATVERLH